MKRFEAPRSSSSGSASASSSYSSSASRPKRDAPNMVEAIRNLSMNQLQSLEVDTEGGALSLTHCPCSIQARPTNCMEKTATGSRKLWQGPVARELQAWTELQNSTGCVHCVLEPDKDCPRQYATCHCKFQNLMPIEALEHAEH